MAVEWFLIALPMVFLLGWFSARLDIRHIRKTAGELPRAYLRGLSHLLRGEKNLALDSFLRAQPLDPESVELQFAIGELSRHRGEFRRALQAHQAICENESLPAADRLRAQWELARDYFQMGFLDLAEKHAARLAASPGYEESAADMLLEILQRARKFEEALAVLDSMPAAAALLRRKTRAHLLCECALRLSPSQRDEKKTMLQNALEADGHCARANLLLAELAMENDDFATAARHCEAVEKQNTDYLWRAAEGLMEAHSRGGDSEAGRRRALAWLDACPSPMLFDKVHRHLSARGEAEGLAERFVPRGLGAAAWAEEQRQAAEDGRRDFWRALQKSLSAVAWRCETCGYQSDNFMWQCHNCLAWESMRRADKAQQ